MKIYLSGPMSGYINHNYYQFFETENRLKAKVLK